MLRIEKYKKDYYDSWNDFVENHSMNGTFMQTQRFLSYHKEDKFVDTSILFINTKNNNIVAVCPACELYQDGVKTFFSHRGSTFGGIVISPKVYNINAMIEIMDLFHEYLHQEAYKRACLKQTSNIFSRTSTELIQYVLQYYNYVEYKEVSTYIDFANYNQNVLSNFTQGKRTNVNNCIKSGLSFKKFDENEEVCIFHDVLAENLSKFNSAPVHTKDELIALKNKYLKIECVFGGVYLDNQIIAGTMMFVFEQTNTIHTQYLAAKQDYHKLSPMSFLYYSVILEALNLGYSKLSWGVSTENMGRTLNVNLLTSKEYYGGNKYSINMTYCRDFE